MAYIFQKVRLSKEMNAYYVRDIQMSFRYFNQGIQNVVSSSGTSLTKEQVRLVKRYTQNLTILYDGDAAGIKASFRGIDLIWKKV